MKALFNLKYSPNSIGITVKVKTPDVDRGMGDFRKIFTKIVDTTDDDLYKLAKLANNYR